MYEILFLRNAADVIKLSDVKSIDDDAVDDVDVENDDDDELSGIKRVMLLDFVMLNLAMRGFLIDMIKMWVIFEREWYPPSYYCIF